MEAQYTVIRYTFDRGVLGFIIAIGKISPQHPLLFTSAWFTNSQQN